MSEIIAKVERTFTYCDICGRNITRDNARYEYDFFGNVGICCNHLVKAERDRNPENPRKLLATKHKEIPR